MIPLLLTSSRCVESVSDLMMRHTFLWFFCFRAKQLACYNTTDYLPISLGINFSCLPDTTLIPTITNNRTCTQIFWLSLNQSHVLHDKSPQTEVARCCTFCSSRMLILKALQCFCSTILRFFFFYISLLFKSPIVCMEHIQHKHFTFPVAWENPLPSTNSLTKNNNDSWDHVRLTCPVLL